MLFLGGSNFDMRLRAPVFDSLLVRHFDVASYEPRGIGRSEAPAGVWTMDDYADDAVAVMDALGWKAPCVLGESFGAMTALRLAIEYPQRVGKLALSAGSPGGADGAAYPIEELLELPPRERATAALNIQDTRFSELGSTNPEKAEDQIASRMNFEEKFLHTLKNENGYRQLLSARSGHDCLSELHKIEMPVLIMAGRYDQQARVEVSRTMAEKIPNAQLRVYEGGHGFCFSSPEPINDLLAQWLSDS